MDFLIAVNHFGVESGKFILAMEKFFGVVGLTGEVEDETGESEKEDNEGD